MPIRYKCDDCGSTLNIKDELAGTQGKCPKCKSAFTVPQPMVEDTDTQRVADVVEATVAKPGTASANPARKKAGGPSDDDFDPMAVLMGDEPSPGGNSAPAPPPLSDDEIPADVDFDLEIGGDPDEEPVPKKAKKRRRVQFDSDDDFDASVPKSASAKASAMLSGGASAGAKDLLTRTMEESRARASRIDKPDNRDQGPTIKDYAREFGPQAAGILAAFFVVTYGLYKLAGSMYGGGLPLPDMGRVYGVVKLDGQPLVGASVRFTPKDTKLSVDGKGKYPYRASTAITDTEGYYDLYYTEDIRGAAATEHRVSIEKFGDDGRLLTPASYYDLTENLKTVETGSQEFNFDLQSDARPPPPGK